MKCLPCRIITLIHHARGGLHEAGQFREGIRAAAEVDAARHPAGVEHAVIAAGGRDGAAKTDDGRLDVKLSSPGTAGTGTNPEQLFASGYAACFIGAMKAVGGKIGIPVPQDVSIDAEVDLGPIPNAYGIAARLAISLPGLDKETAQKLVDAAHQVCPYSNATRGNIDVTITIV